MTILAIETSCDDTCIAILKIENCKLKILSNVVSSQVKLHAKYGGIYPSLAKREHQKNLPIVLKKAIREAKKSKIDLIAVTVGPGLEPCLWTGVNFAKDLAKNLKLPIIPINHIEAHILVNFLPFLKFRGREIWKKFVQLLPAICLVVSGGHTQLILMPATPKSQVHFRDHIKYKILGETRDDAAGECLDKVARILGLGYPGGPIISKLAEPFSRREVSPIRSINLPRPMMHQKNYDFSFSGLKTAVLYNFKSKPGKIRKSTEYIQAICTEVQQAVIDVLISKTLRAAAEYKVKAIILGGGVTANEELRKQFKSKIQSLKSEIQFLAPPKNLSTDNAVMVAAAAYFRHLQEEKKAWGNIEVNANLRLK